VPAATGSAPPPDMTMGIVLVVFIAARPWRRRPLR
jgi:hypothetical protein